MLASMRFLILVVFLIISISCSCFEDSLPVAERAAVNVNGDDSLMTPRESKCPVTKMVRKFNDLKYTISRHIFDKKNIVIITIAVAGAIYYTACRQDYFDERFTSMQYRLDNLVGAIRDNAECLSTSVKFAIKNLSNEISCEVSEP